MAWSVRNDNPNINPGCGLPLYFQILTNTYGRIPAYVYVVYGLIFPYLNDPYKNFELSNTSNLQKLYNEGELNYDFVNISSHTGKNKLMNTTNNITQNITKNLPNYE
jgi:hypothetical protein